MTKLKKWLEIKVPVNTEVEDTISNYLFENGSVGCYTSEDILFTYFKKSDWNCVKFQKFKNYLKELSDLGFYVNAQNIKINELEDQDWNVRWKESLKPIFVLPDLIIKPTWSHFTPPKNVLVIEINPQMAFGSGYHDTTQLMLKLMKSFIHPEQRILDIGTGSGILAITAVKLNASKVFACDIDPVAVSTAKMNVSINAVSQNIYLFTGTIDCFANASFDVILININRKEIFKILTGIRDFLNPDGCLILSGLLINEEEILLKTLNNLNFSPLTISRQNEWLGLVIT